MLVVVSYPKIEGSREVGSGYFVGLIPTSSNLAFNFLYQFERKGVYDGKR